MKFMALVLGLLVQFLASAAYASDDVNPYPSMDNAIKNHLAEEASMKGLDQKDLTFLLHANLGMITVDYINKTYLNLKKYSTDKVTEIVMANGNLGGACATQMVAISNIKDEIKNTDAKILAGKDYEAVAAVCMAMN